MTDALFFSAIALTLAFAFVNGFHDGCNVIATMIGSRSMSPRRALLYASLAEFAGPFLLGTAVAGTIAAKILQPELMNALDPKLLFLLVIAAVLGAIIWNIVTWILGLPSSSSHALIGGLIGAGFPLLGAEGIAVERIMLYVLIPLFISPPLGFIAGYIVFALIRKLFGRSPASIGSFFVWLQLPGMLFLGASHGSNDAQKSMGLIVLVLMAGAPMDGGFAVPLWVVAACAAAIALGLYSGGWSIIKTVGFDIFRMQPVHSFSSQFASTGVIVAASILGGPVSTTQVVASSVLGVGASNRLSAVRWSLAKTIAMAWILTIPAAACVSGGLCWVGQRILEML